MAASFSPGYRGLPQMAGLCTLADAQRSDWSVDESVRRQKHLHYLLRRAYEIFTFRITGEPIYELKMAFSYHGYLCAEQVGAVRKRVGEMREPPLGLDQVPHPGLKHFCDEILAAPSSETLVFGLYEHLIPAIEDISGNLIRDAHPLADSPTVRVARLILSDLAEIQEYGHEALKCLVTDDQRREFEPWAKCLQQCLSAVGGPDGTQLSTGELPAAMFLATPFQFQSEPQRDERFQDPFNAGVNPEAFLYDERFSPRDKTLMMYYKRIRELDVPEMMASILYDLNHEEPWGFHEEMSRQLWDEARHAMMGEVGFASLGLDWTEIPINFTWSRNLNSQLNARERHGVLYFIEQGLMPKTGKRYEWEVGLESGDSLSALFQDFDWADEVLHSQIGRRWYVPRFSSLNEALDYGDDCWSKVMSHWRDDRDQGRTEHRNWWPDLYRQACAGWGVDPDPAALAYDETYEDTRADLKDISMSG
ncbi:MAG: hypothetical protein KDA80_05805 [Planctomycetaceae bacterium]|nr:hypothetical protein [Planctomycetaceae bacterium]